jgi:hypothetical protein
VRVRLLSLLVAFGLVLPFVDKPVHVDDANFLRLAEGAVADVWRPHAVQINWQGKTETAFDVLSNPPGIAWWLAPVVDAPVTVQHLWMLPWLLLALWGAHQLGKAFVGDGRAALLLVATSPVVLLAAQALTPDLPLLACTLAGVGGFLNGRGAWALLAGCAVLFRYSGLCLWPLMALFGWQHRRPAAALVLVPGLLLFAHDLQAYGQLHVAAMGSFQSVANTPWEVLRKGVAALAMLGGAGVLGVLTPKGWPGAVAGALLGLGAGLVSGQGGIGLVMTVACTASGGALLAGLRWRSPQDRGLLAWTVGGLVFLLMLRFAATRYWLPFLIAPLLAALRLRPGMRRIALVATAQAALALGLSWDDRAFARAHQTLAEAVIERGTGSFAGHWGWQHHMEQAGWRALEDDGPPDALHAEAVAPWPQQPDRACERIDTLSVLDDNPGPRTHTAAGAANLHAYVVASSEVVETYAPWSFSNEPYDIVHLWQCRDSHGGLD